MITMYCPQCGKLCDSEQLVKGSNEKVLFTCPVHHKWHAVFDWPVSATGRDVHLVIKSQKYVDQEKDKDAALTEMIAAAREINRAAGHTVFNPTALSMAVAALDAK
jgi:hypothetical protein